MHTAAFKAFLYSLFMPSGHFAALSEELESDPHSHLLGGRSCFQDWVFSKPDAHLSSASCIFILASERSSGSGSSGGALQGLSLQRKHGPKALNALWSPAGKPMDVRTAGVPPNDRGDGLLLPFPFPAIPELLFQGRTASRGSGARLPGLVRISGARHRAAAVTRGRDTLRRSPPWTRNNARGERLSPAEVQLRPLGAGSESHRSAAKSTPTRRLWHGQRRRAASRGWEMQDKMLQFLRDRETALADASDRWLICPEHTSEEQASSCKLFSPRLNRERGLRLWRSDRCCYQSQG